MPRQRESQKNNFELFLNSSTELCSLPINHAILTHRRSCAYAFFASTTRKTLDFLTNVRRDITQNHRAIVMILRRNTMFGYVTINKPELKIREYDRYRQFYCGLCHVLKERHGIIGQCTLTYDMTFLVILLSSLYEPETTRGTERCIAHPARKHSFVYNEITNYCADMNIALTYHKLLDDWNDDRSIKGWGGTKLLHSSYKKIHDAYPDTCSLIEESLHQLSEMEADNVQNIDQVAGCFGRLMAGLLDYKQDIWSPYLKKFGFYLGKFIYMIDAYLDLEEDKEKGHYNPLTDQSQAMEAKDFQTSCMTMLELMMADACHQFELLPLEQDIELLRNILYAGVMNKLHEKKEG